MPYPISSLHFSPVYGFLKASGKPVFIIDLSAPKDNSINSFIPLINKKTTYPLFFDVCDLALRVGNNGWFWTADALDAYWKIPINKKFKHLFAIKWRNKILIFNCLTFGLASAPAIYNKFIKLFLAICNHNHFNLFNCKQGNLILQYLDDFFGGHLNKNIAQFQKDFLLKKFDLLNLPTSPKKCKGPSQTITILGWFISSIPILTITLAGKKREKYLAAVILALKNKKSNLFLLQKLIGYLRYTTYILPIGKMFIHPLDIVAARLNRDIENKKVKKYKQSFLSKESIFCLLVWKRFFIHLKNYHVPIKHLRHPNLKPVIYIWSDASAKLDNGIGGFDILGNWYKFSWNSLKIKKNHKFYKFIKKTLSSSAAIQYMELLSIVTHIAQFSNYFRSKHLIIKNDNPVAVKICNTGTIKKDAKIYYPLYNLLNILVILSIKYKFTFQVLKIDGDDNKIADALSRFFDNPFNYPQPDLNKSKFIKKSRTIVNSTVHKLICNSCIPFFQKNIVLNF